MHYLFHPEAEAELNAAVDYYQECKEGLDCLLLQR